MTNSLGFPGIAIASKIYESDRCIVYRGTRESDELPLIIKLLKKDYPTSEELARYQQEYDLIRTIDFEGVIKAYALQKYENTLMIFFEDFQGESLKYWLQKQSFSILEFLELAIKITKALEEIHRLNIVHQEINPSNLIWNPTTQQLKIIDFSEANTAPRRDRNATASFSSILSREGFLLSNSNFLKGTLAYISPEQTGKIERAIDYRTDFYSLGVTFYELLTNRLPFESSDLLELIHCHIAKQAIPINKIRLDIPHVISEIIFKLLAKTVEKRYQTARGIIADLETCLRQLKSSQIINSFSLASQDFSETFQLSQKLYDREKQLQILLKAFERVSKGQTELITISGSFGTGKSSLVREVLQLVTQAKGYSLLGKFDKLKPHIFYGALIEAFKEFFKNLLTESEFNLQLWREKICSFLEADTEYIAEIIPELKLIIKQQSSASKISFQDNQERLKLALKKLLYVFGTKQHPFVIVFNDLQWADIATLELIEDILTDIQASCLLLIVTYRDDETNSNCLERSLRRWQQKKLLNEEIVLQSLDEIAVNQLIADTLKCARKRSQSLAHLVVEKTGGNPFFVKAFLETLYREKLISFLSDRPIAPSTVDATPQSGKWVWNLEQIKVKQMTDNVIDLTIANIQKLPKTTQQVLKMASCIGERFELKVLASIVNNSQTNAANELRLVVKMGLVIPISGERRFHQIAQDFDELNVTYQFAHDRIQQASYSLIPDKDKSAIQIQIGRSLLNCLNPQQQQERIFEIVERLNFGIALLECQQQRNELSLLNFFAGRKAKAAASYLTALNYFKIAIELLSENTWHTQYSVSLALYESAIETSYIVSDFETVKQWSKVVLQNASTILDTINIYCIKIKTYIAQNQLTSAIDLGLQVLSLLDIKLPRSLTIEESKRTFQEIAAILSRERVEELLNLPIMTDADKLAALRVIATIMPEIIHVMPGLFPWLSCQEMQITLNYGSSIFTPLVYADYAKILNAVERNFEGAYQFGRLAIAAIQASKTKEVESITYFKVAAFAIHGKQHVRETLSLFATGYESGLQNGELVYAGYCASEQCQNSYLIGTQLEQLAQQIAKYRHIFEPLKQTTACDSLKIIEQAVQILSATTTDKNFSLDLDFSAPNSNRLILHAFYLHQLILDYLFDDRDRALQNAIAAETYLDAVSLFLARPIFYFYDSLTRLALYPQLSLSDRKTYLAKVTQNQVELKTYAIAAPMNFSHKFYLIEAEKYRVLGGNSVAADLYDRAIEIAKENNYLNEEALAYELGAKFYLERGKRLIAKTYMQEAYYNYLTWGANAKAQNILKKYPQFFYQSSLIKPLRFGKNNPNSERETPQESFLDIVTIVKAYQTISSEIVLDNLLAKLMKIVIENIGAQIGYLLIEKAEKWTIEATSSVDGENITVIQSIPIEESKTVAASIIYYVARTKESVVLNDASSQEKFKHDTYIQERQPKSILCAPLLYQNKAIAIIYLENNLTTDAFTSERLELIKLLCAQAAISLENARLYAEKEDYAQTLEQKVIERTAELERANQKLNRLATIDGLTQIANRRYFDEYLSSQWKRLKREKQPLSLILFDVDYFKLYNDRYGHQAGDECLKKIARALKQTLKRPADLAARYGGEEFVAILPNTPIEGAAVVAMAISENVRQLQILHERSQVSQHVTLSIGVAGIVPTQESSPQELLAAADRMLYQAKQQGRDRIQWKR